MFFIPLNEGQKRDEIKVRFGDFGRPSLGRLIVSIPTSRVGEVKLPLFPYVLPTVLLRITVLKGWRNMMLFRTVVKEISYVVMLWSAIMTS